MPLAAQLLALAWSGNLAHGGVQLRVDRKREHEHCRVVARIGVVVVAGASDVEQRGDDASQKASVGRARGPRRSLVDTLHLNTQTKSKSQKKIY